jgi:alanyl-tRNA synthetase
VNRWIQADLGVDWRVVPIDEARAAGAMMLFGEKYGKNVRMVTVGSGAGAGAPSGTSVSIELCGGTHVARSGQIGLLVITAEEAVSAGVRRVEARTGAAALAYLAELRRLQRDLVGAVGGNAAQLEERVGKLIADLRESHRDVARLRDRLAAAQTAATPVAEVQEAGGFTFTTLALDGLDAAALRNAADTQLTRTGADLIVVGSGALIVVKTTEAARTRGANAGSIVRAIASRVGGGGGGKPDLAQAGLKDPSSLAAALAAVPEALAG